jgi:hypothetical protein
MPFNQNWDETFPSDNQVASLGADDIRKLTYAIRERLAVDHYFLAIEGGDVKIGYHNKTTFVDQTADILGAAGAVRLYGKTVAGKVELFLVMADNTVVQLTSNGKLNSAAIQGVIPIANLATGVADGTKYIRDDGTLQVINTDPPVGTAVQSVITLDQTARTITAAVFSADNSAPLVAGGAEYTQLATSFTPKKATNRLIIECVINCSQNGGAGFRSTQAVLFNGSTALAMGVNRQAYDAGGSGYETVPCTKPVCFTYTMIAGTTAAIPFKVRVGADEGTVYTNIDGVSYTHGNVMSSSLKITEVEV